VSAIVPLLGDMYLALRIADVDPLIAHQQADNTEADLRIRHRGQAQRLLDLARGRIDEYKAAQVLGDQRAPLLGKGEIDRTAGKGDLLAGRCEDLVGGHNNAAVGLDSNLETVLLVRHA